MQETGVLGYESSVWPALLAPTGTPNDIVTKLNMGIAKVVNTLDAEKALYYADVKPTPSTPQVISDYLVKEMDRWRKVAKDIGIKVE